MSNIWATTQHFVAQFLINMIKQHFFILTILVCCFSNVSSHEISIVRFPSLRSILDSMKTMFDNVQRRTFFLKPEKKEKPSYHSKPYKPLDEKPNYVHHHQEEFQPVPPPLSYNPNPVHHDYEASKPSYLNFWSYFPLGQVTPIRILAGIMGASENVEHDGGLWVVEKIEGFFEIFFIFRNWWTEQI